ncbi:MAG: hypothetical protein ACLFVR_14635 [Thiohalospira sp.]
MTNREIIELHQNLKDPAIKNLKGIKLIYVLNKNMSKLENEIKSVKAASEASKEYGEFEEKRIAINEKFVKRNEDGTHVTNKINEHSFEYVIDEGKKQVFEKEMEALKKEYADVINQHKEQIKEYNAFLDEKSNFKPHYIESKYLPDDIEWGQLLLIRKLVK